MSCLCVLALTTQLGCGRAEGPASFPEGPAARDASATVDPAAQTPESSAARTALPQWWTAGDDACPESARLVGQPPPDGTQIECVNDDGELHGRRLVWSSNGRAATLTEYRNNIKNGTWAYFSDGRSLATGNYVDGRKEGDWFYWLEDDEGPADEAASSLVDFFGEETWSARKRGGATYVVESYSRGLRLRTRRYRGSKMIP